jgi:hypothetical protein
VRSLQKAVEGRKGACEIHQCQEYRHGEYG